uniref:Ig-like domain-containing protein n=1 Tax=Hucho hucho TaxID=62062 RepID=A0A4W5MM04_9TELE
MAWIRQTELTQPGSMTLKPGQPLTLSCKVSGYSVTSTYCTAWIQQTAGKSLEWIGVICYDDSTAYKDSLKHKFSITRDTSSNPLFLKDRVCRLKTNLQTEDTAVYYCARQPQKGCLAPSSQCIQANKDLTTYLMCMIEDFTPKKVTVTWKKNVKKVEGPTPTVGLQTSGLFSASSLLKVKNTDWNNKVKYICVVQHQEQTITKTISKTGLYIGVD